MTKLNNFLILFVLIFYSSACGYNPMYSRKDIHFNINNIETGSWGNKKSVISNLRNDDKWTRVGFYSKLNNEKNFPLQVWGLAKI